MNKKVIYKDLGIIPYKQAWDYQETIFGRNVELKRYNNDLPELEKVLPENHLLFCEHPHVYTLGKSGSEQNLLINYIQLQAKNAEFFKTNRGGDITYHGPGQIVGYPIFDLEQFNMGLKDYIHHLEQAIINGLAEFKIKAERLTGATGVWLDTERETGTRKICSIGVRSSRFVTMHGFALNVNTDLTYFDHINPCGFTDKAVTSIEKECGTKQDFEQCKNVFKKHLGTVFGF